MSQPSVSLFDTLIQRLGDNTPLVRMTKQTVIHLAQTFESFVMQDGIECVLFIGFQDTIYTRTSPNSMARLYTIAEKMVVFSGDPPTDQPDNVLHCQLAPGNPLRQEWFVVLLTDRYHALLCSHQRTTIITESGEPEFDIVWTFTPEIIGQCVSLLMDVVAASTPHEAESIRRRVAPFALTESSPVGIIRVMAKLLYRIENLHQDLNQQQNMIAALLNTIQHGVYILEVKQTGAYQTLYQSPQSVTLFGRAYPSQGKVEDQYTHIHPDDREQVIQTRSTQPTDTSVSLEFRVQHSDGHYLWVEDTVTTQADPERKLTTVYGMVRDITEEVELREHEREQERLRLLVEKEREVNAVKTYFMTNVSHEFRTPLAIILSASQLMERYWDRLSEDDRTQRFAQIHEQVMHLSNILNDMTTILHGNLEHLGFHPEPRELMPFLKTLVAQSTMRVTSRTFEETYGDDLGTGQIDPKLLKHIVTNLLSNAIKFSHADAKIIISADRKDDTLFFCVKDAGIGIPADELDAIFGVFHRAKNAFNYGGTGLGLYIAQTCAQLHGGEITVTSEVDNGARFKLQIPLNQAE